MLVIKKLTKKFRFTTFSKHHKVFKFFLFNLSGVFNFIWICLIKSSKFYWNNIFQCCTFTVSDHYLNCWMNSKNRYLTWKFFWFQTQLFTLTSCTTEVIKVNEDEIKRNCSFCKFRVKQATGIPIVKLWIRNFASKWLLHSNNLARM
jgi:hypothetical protein